MFMFCLAFSMSLLTSGVMLKRSLRGMERGTMGERSVSGCCLGTTTAPKWINITLLVRSLRDLLR